MTSETMRLDDFSTGGIWDAEAHVRFLRSSAGASSGFTADLIEKLYSALTATRPDTGDHIADAGKMVGKPGMTNPSETSELLAKLRADADLLDAWEHFELGTEPPDPMHYAKVAARIREAADTIDRLTSSGEAVGWTSQANIDGLKDHDSFVIGSIINRQSDEMNVPLYTHASPREGHVEVPVEPTDAMIEAGLDSLRDNTGILCIDRDPLFVWRAMVRAALPNQGQTKP